MRILLGLFIAAFSINIYCQDFDLLYNASENGTQSHIARNSITLDPNYSYSPNGGTLTIEIQNPVVTGAISYGTAIDPETRVLSTSYFVGATQGNFSVNPIGGASYNIPLELPPGVNGLTPQLSLNYSSNAGSGIAGFGWQIGGLSAVSRGVKSFFHDGVYKGIEMDSTDRFYLDGQRLVNTLAFYNNYSNVKYRTDNDIFTRVTPRDINASYGPTWFNAEAKSGLIYEYGHTSGSQQTINGNNQVLNWYVSKVSDRFGNQINYAYLKDNYSIYPAEITYGPNTITFFYKERTDIKPEYFKGTKILQRFILEKVTVKYNNSILKTYEFKYALEGNSYNSISLLSEIIEYGIGTDRINSTAISYQEPNDVSMSQTTYNTTSSIVNYKALMIPGDYNGDGKTDVACFPIAAYGATWTGMRVCYSDGLDAFVNVYSNQSTYVPKYQDDIRTYDINGDGKQDLVYERKAGGFYYMVSTGNSFSNPVLFKTHIWIEGSGNGLIGKIPRYIGVNSDDNQIAGEDYNGDGINDIFLNDDNGDWMLYSFANSSGQLSSTLNLLDYGTNSNMKDKIISGDFNGDGKVDIWCFQSTGMKVYTWNGTDLVLLYTASTPTSNHVLNMGDFNADGKSDLFIYGFKSGSTVLDYTIWQIQLSTGTGFELYGIPKKKNNLKDDYVRLADFNGDNATDVMVTSSDESWNGTKFYISKNNGMDFQAHELTDYPISTHRFYLGDFNGDANTDFFCTDGKSPWWNGYQMYKTSENTNFLVNKIGDGLGNIIKLSYIKLSQAPNTIYNIGSGAVFPLCDYQGPITIVKKIEFDDGLGSIKSQQYYYEGLKIHKQGKGFLGYSKSRLTDYRLGIITENTCTFNTTYFSPSVTVYSKKLYGQANPYETDTTKWSQIVFSQSKKWIIPYIQKSVQSNSLTGQLIKIVSSCDNFGNPTTVTKTINNGNIQVLINTYENLESSWLLGRATISSVQNTNNEGTITKSIQRTFGSGNNSLSSETIYSGTDKEIVHSYLYNANGTLQNETITSGGISRTSQYTYETNGIRILSITDPLSHATTNSYDTYGRLLTQQDYLNNTVIYGYDNMHKQTSVSKNIGNSESSVSIVYSWENPSGTPIRARYSIQSAGNNGSQTKTWYDKLGRTLRSDVVGFDGNLIFNSTEYNSKGQLYRQSEPYNSVETPVWNIFTYDSYGRKISLTTPSGQNSNWQYTSGTGIVTETTAGKIFTKEFASDGSLTSATDAGGTITYTYYADGKTKSITAPGGIITTMQYDIAGNQIQLVDPSSGTMTYTYNGFGELLTQQNSRNQTNSFSYYSDGRIQQKLTPEGTTTYSYNTNKQLTGITLLTGITSNNISRTFEYDTHGRIANVSEIIDGTTYPTDYSYDNKGRVSTITHSTDIVETNNYNNYGYLASISADGVTQWTTLAVNSRGQVTSGRYGATLNASYTYNNYGFPVSIITGSLQNSQYQFNPVNGNLNLRSNGLIPGLQENFEYDALDRLDRIFKGSDTLLDMTYSGSNMTEKSDLGTMEYQYSNKPYQVSAISSSTGLIPNIAQSIEYTSFESVSNITENGYTADFIYNADNERAKMLISRNGSGILTRIYASDSYIKETTGTTTKEYTFIGGDAYSAPAVAIKQNGGTTNYYYLLRDYLGSITHVVDASTNTTVAEYSYDAWGRMRDSATWINDTLGGEPTLMIAGRGYTGHEHLPWFNLINMNGRLYDPLTGQFLSADNYIQAPTFSPSFNRYSYCLNNPLKYTDPSGEGWEIWLGAGAIGGVLNVISNWDDIDGDFVKFNQYAFVGCAAGSTAAAMAESGIGAPAIGMCAGGITSLGNAYIKGARDEYLLEAAAQGTITGGISGFATEVLGALLNEFLKIPIATDYPGVPGSGKEVTIGEAFSRLIGKTTSDYIAKQGISDALIILSSYNQISGGVRPDADGYVTWNEAKLWARRTLEPNRDLYVDLNKIDFSNVRREEFGSDGILEVKLAGKHFSNLDDGLVHGSIWLQIDKNGYATIHNNTSFSFDFTWNEGDSFWRNIATKILEQDIKGPFRMHYKTFNIYYRGDVYIRR